ncbi:tektin-B1-like [Leuresthes tenuis]|uniref:tektin-B1-like n=1 Tax=Leuresthes tenuis TaxID=355514 RepID=UPI003B5094AF
MDQLPLLDDTMFSTLGDDISQVPSAIRNTMGHLTSRHMEVSQWQAFISESISRVDREIAAVEQVKVVAERCLHERQLYSQLMSNCVALSCGLTSTVLRQDRVFNELRKEEHLTNESRDLVQTQICCLLDKLSSLQKLRTQLLADFQDKSEAIKLTSKCITHQFETPSSRLPTCQYKPIHVSYEKWLSHCKNLRLTAENLVKESSSFRGNLQFSLTNLKNSQERQRHSTDTSLRRKIHELTRFQDTMMWERQRIKEEISDLTKDIQKVASQVRNCDSRLHQANHRLDILNHRPRYELCLDNPHISLTLEKQDLTKMEAGLRSVLKRTQQNLELTHRRLVILEDKLAKNACTLEMEQRCQKVHQSFLPALDTAVVLTNKPRMPAAINTSSICTYLQ